MSSIASTENIKVEAKDESKPAVCSVTQSRLHVVKKLNLVPQVRLADMSDDLQQSAQEIVAKAFADYTVEKDRAQCIKKEMDR